MELFKTYEHVLLVDSVVDHFKAIVNKVLNNEPYVYFLIYIGQDFLFYLLLILKCKIEQTKKFAKPELKSCIDEFEDKLNKFHMEKKEQEVTARNAQIHQQKIGCMDDISVTQNPKEDKAESDTTEGQCSNLIVLIFV